VQTTNLVQASADVVRITTLTAGDVYKRFDTPSYGGPDLLFGVVQDVLNNGTTVVITAVEYSNQGVSVVAKMKVFGPGTDLALFAATPAEVGAHLGEVLKAANYAVVDAEKSLAAARAARDGVRAALARSLDGELTAAETEVERPALQG
jgi:hypothetical protein